jgi:ABC-2 type transport system permease protein
MFGYYRQQFAVSLAIYYQYRIGYALYLLEGIIRPVIFMVVWQAAAGNDAIGGYGATDFAAYYIIVVFVSHFVLAFQMWEYEYYIRVGELSSKLLRPIHPIHRDISNNISNKFLMSPVIIVTVIGLALAFKPEIHTPIWALAASIPVIILAAMTAFVAGWCVAMAAFWTVRSIALNQMYFAISIFLSGEFAPLNVLPKGLQIVADFLPFRWIMAFPVELIMGRLSGAEVLSGVIAQFIWIGLGLTAGIVIWQKSLKRYSAVGG